MIVRIPLTEFNSWKTFLYPDLSDLSDRSDQSDGSDGSDGSDRSDSSASSDFQLIKPEFRLVPAELEAYHSSRYAYPVAEINVVVPEADKPLVSSWLGNASPSSAVASETLIKRMTAAVISAYSGFVTDAGRSSLFTSPFRIGVALRRRDGKYAYVSTPELMVPNAMAPLMPLREASPVDDSLATLTEIRIHPCQLTVNLPSFYIADSLLAQLESIEIFATCQTSLLSGDESVTAIRSYLIEGTSLPCWYFKRLAEDIVREKALQSTDYRVIATIPIAEAKGGISGLQLPQNYHDISDWSQFPKFSDKSGGSGDGGEEPVIPGVEDATGMIIYTGALDLGLPEKNKRIRGVTLRGVFPRRGETGEEVKFTLYGSHHRTAWRKIAVATGPHIRLLRGIRYRWLKVEIEGTPTAVCEALTFEVK